MNSKNSLIEIFKNETERKFFPKIEYLPPEEIRNIFMAANMNDVEKMTNKEVLEFYTEWYTLNEQLLKPNTDETEKPDIEE